MTIGSPDYTDSMIPGRTVAIQGQDPTTINVAGNIPASGGLNVSLYTVPAGKRLYLWRVELMSNTSMFIYRSLVNLTKGLILKAYFIGHEVIDFPAGAVWVYDAGEVVSIYFTNPNDIIAAMDINMYGTEVDV